MIISKPFYLLFAYIYSSLFLGGTAKETTGTQFDFIIIGVQLDFEFQGKPLVTGLSKRRRWYCWTRFSRKV
jgi:hypothetical protein